MSGASGASCNALFAHSIAKAKSFAASVSCAFFRNPSIAGLRSGCTCTAESSPVPAARIARTAAAGSIWTVGLTTGDGGAECVQAARVSMARRKGTQIKCFMVFGMG